MVLPYDFLVVAQLTGIGEIFSIRTFNLAGPGLEPSFNPDVFGKAQVFSVSLFSWGAVCSNSAARKSLSVNTFGFMGQIPLAEKLDGPLLTVATAE